VYETARRALEGHLLRQFNQQIYPQQPFTSLEEALSNSFVKNNIRNEQKKSNHRLFNKNEFQKLLNYNIHQSDPINLDTTLICKLFNIAGLSLPNRAVPGTILSTQDAIFVIRTTRNYLAHSNGATIEMTTYNSLTARLREALIVLGVSDQCMNNDIESYFMNAFSDPQWIQLFQQYQLMNQREGAKWGRFLSQLAFVLFCD